ncbi:4-(cytidine 5'-diphospho)-2-C-methyl-D-erythritol kinase [Sneathiella sp.]|uniref:4-(cytidine 5'-diphospho)-2-C-methyl-D-erythritol kinase n=1 Tax=Sneathiella sp. TaxID=1964365 RepID=UPI002FE25380
MIDALAPAKINLFLHVTGKRADGYHLLESLVAFAAYGDRISVAPADNLTLEMSGPFASETDTGPDNLVWKAAEQLRRAAGVRHGAHIHLVKNLPVASGIGGGSSDAATTLKLLNRAWNLKLAPERLAEIGLSVGADVPVCLLGKPAMMRGIGEQLEEIPGFELNHIILVNCNIKVSTAEVFRRLPRIEARPAVRSSDMAGGVDLAAFLGATRNDLERPAMEIEPMIADAIAAVSALAGCRLARMSGSGATVFGLFATAGAARDAAVTLTARHPGWWTRATRLQGGA